MVCCLFLSFTCLDFFTIFLTPAHILEPVKAPVLDRDPCIPSPCGANALCQRVGDTPACSCLSNYFGSPPNCRPECTVNSDCPSNKACMQERCKDPCPGSCGFDAECSVLNHVPNCRCREGFSGDPFSQCRLIPVQSKFHGKNVYNNVWKNKIFYNCKYNFTRRRTSDSTKSVYSIPLWS